MNSMLLRLTKLTSCFVNSITHTYRHLHKSDTVSLHMCTMYLLSVCKYKYGINPQNAMKCFNRFNNCHFNRLIVRNYLTGKAISALPKKVLHSL